MELPSVSIVIRTKNEKQRLEELLSVLATQDYKGSIEIVCVDTESTDGMAELLNSRNIKVINVKQKEFSYPKSMNLGVSQTKGELVIGTVGHALPFTKDWISSGVKHFSDPKVAGVFGPPKARKDGTLIEKIFYGTRYYRTKIEGVQIATPQKFLGIMGATNCMFRKSLWKQHNFDERYGAGGEDVEWANWAINQGYKIIADPKFSVMHSHGNNRKQLKEQIEYWKKLGEPHPFNKEDLKFRVDIK